MPNLFVKKDIHTAIRRIAITSDAKIGRVADDLLLEEQRKGLTDDERRFLAMARVQRENRFVFDVPRETIRGLRLMAADLDITLATLTDFLFRRALTAGG